MLELLLLLCHRSFFKPPVAVFGTPGADCQSHTAAAEAHGLLPASDVAEVRKGRAAKPLGDFLPRWAPMAQMGG